MMAKVLARSHVAAGCDRATLGAIHDPTVNLAIWDRTPPVTFTTADLARVESCDVAVTPMTIGAALCGLAGCRAPLRAALTRDIAMLVQCFARIVGTEQLRLRLERITGNACWKFHADYVPVRLICTYTGQGTQWLEESDPARVRQLATGAVGLFKGRVLAPDDPIIHRSPPIAGTGETRLLLVIDPFAPD